MSYMSYEEYEAIPGLVRLDAEEFERRAPYADLIIDDWTLERVGRAVSEGKALPRPVRLVYCQIVDNLDEMIGAEGERVASFSNGQDSYTFDLSENKANAVWHHALQLLPVEWISANVCYRGGADDAR